MLDPNNRKSRRLISQTPVSRHTVARKISRISANVKDKLQNNLANATAFSLSLDESTDVTDNLPMVVYVCYVSSDKAVRRIVGLHCVKGNNSRRRYKKALDEILMKAKIPLNKFVRVATDGAPAMVGKNAGLIALIKNDSNYPDFLPIHCTIHRENLTSR